MSQRHKAKQKPAKGPAHWKMITYTMSKVP